jgi:hypothetical protein
MAPKKDLLDTLHRDIPKDANGDPVFFILPDDMQASYERKLRKSERGWQATGDPAFLTEAEILTHLHRQVSSLWLAEANIALNAKRRTKGHAKHAIETGIRWMRYDTLRTAKEHGLHWLQHQAKAATRRAIEEKKRAAELARDVEAKDEKVKAERAAEAAAEYAKEAQRRAGKIERRGWVTWPEAETLAVEWLARTRAAGESETIRKSYAQVKDDFEAGRGAMYLTRKQPRITLAEALSRARD